MLGDELDGCDAPVFSWGRIFLYCGGVWVAEVRSRWCAVLIFPAAGLISGALMSSRHLLLGKPLTEAVVVQLKDW